MKKIFLYLVAVVAITAIAVWNVSQSKNETALTDVAMENVEALAGGEINPDCPNGCLAQCGNGCYCNGWHELYREATWN